MVMNSPTSIFLLFLLMGVAWTFPWKFPTRSHGNETVFEPIMSRSETKRICVELCMSGLGGESCGDDCVDLSPLTVAFQSDPADDAGWNETHIGYPRSDSCPVLCANNLGYPLCNCNKAVSGKPPNFVQVCGHFCLNYNYQIFGCQTCDVYRDLKNDKYMASYLVPDNNSVNYQFVGMIQLSPYWIQWCIDKCAEGEGGSACNCDKPVMAI